jgi:hypothetical protein
MPAVTPPDRALDMPRDIPRGENRRSKLPIRPGADRTWARLGGCPELVSGGGGELIGGAGSGDPSVAAPTHVTGDVAAGMSVNDAFQPRL